MHKPPKQYFPFGANSAARLSLLILCVCFIIAIEAALAAGRQPARSQGPQQTSTTSPIRHVIVIVGENRSFDHIFGLYRPHQGQRIWNLLSERIVNADGTPGPNFKRAAQFEVPAQQVYYIDAPAKMKYARLPPPVLDGAPGSRRDLSPPFKSMKIAAAVERDLEAPGQSLLTTGATSAAKAQRIDTRVKNYGGLPDGPFQLTGPGLPYDSYTGDTVHKFFQMWQQSDCAPANASDTNPAGCLSDLYPFVAVSFSHSGEGGGNSMAFYNVNDGDAPLLRRLADEFTSADNFHQAFMGGTGANHMMLGTGDALFFTSPNGEPAIPAIGIANPNPQSGSNNRYISTGLWTDCSDLTSPGVQPIAHYLEELKISPKCEPGHYYMINNTLPGFLPNGALRSGWHHNFVPPSSLRTIGDALSEKGISWTYFGGAFDAAVRLANGSKDSADRSRLAYCQICNPFQYVSSIMTNPAMRTAHLKDVQDLFHALRDGSLPAVSFVKPDAMIDGHPAQSKLDLFEAFVKNILDRLHNNPALEHDTALFITFDESGGYYDSGYIQPLDFFGDGPRIPLIVVSDFSKGGRVVHTYYDHVSILKFIERNWMVRPLTARSRDNLRNPTVGAQNPYVPRNGPAIGDLFDAFDFNRVVSGASPE